MNIKVYSTPTCPYCKMAKEYLSSKGIAYEDIDISMNSTLTVNPGQTVYFDLGTGFSVFGYLTAAGNNTSAITFTSGEGNPSFGDPSSR